LKDQTAILKKKTKNKNLNPKDCSAILKIKDKIQKWTKRTKMQILTTWRTKMKITENRD